MKVWILLSAAVALFVIAASCDKEVITNSPVQSATGHAKIVIASTPLGAKIYLNGKNMGLVTPDSLVLLPSGKYRVTLKYLKYPDRYKDFEIQDSGKYFFYYDYDNDPDNFGILKCSSTPSNAKIYFNDSLLSEQTPLSIEHLRPGNYKLKVTYPMYRSDSAFVDIKGGQTSDVNFVLEDTTVWVTYTKKNSLLSSNFVTAIAVDKLNNKWFGLDNGDLYKYDGKNWKVNPFKSYITCITVDKQNNNIWVGTKDGLQFYDYAANKWYNYTLFVPSSNISSVAIDKNEMVWVGTDKGLGVYNGATWSAVDSSSELADLVSEFITCITVDNFNNVWIGTDKGINVVDRQKLDVWKTILVSDMKINWRYGNFIQDIKADQNGIIWVGHKRILYNETSGVTKFDGHAWSVVLIAGFPLYNVQGLNVDAENNLWISTNDVGLARFSEPNKTLIFNAINSKILQFNITNSVIDMNGDLYVATWSGVGKLKKKNFSPN